MKLKEIKPGMIIHCKTDEERNALYDELCRIGNITNDLKDSRENFVNASLNYRIEDLKRATWSFTEAVHGIEFSDLIIPEEELSTVEVMKDWKETKCGKCKVQRSAPICNSCYRYDKIVPMTNADRIRYMSDEELAEYLEKLISGKRSEVGIDCVMTNCMFDKCTKCIMTWLQKEVE